MYLRWALVFEDPRTRAVWVGKALPREWLVRGADAVVADNVPTRYGRIGMRLKTVATTTTTTTASGSGSGTGITYVVQQTTNYPIEPTWCSKPPITQ